MAAGLVRSSSGNRLTTKLRAMKSGSISSVHMLVKLFELQMMSEGRKAEIVLLDGRKLCFLIQPKLYAGELLDMAASHFGLKEKEYFGLHFNDSSGQNHWLQLDRCVLDHSFLKSAGPLVIYLVVRFFLESISYLKDQSTAELFYLQARQAIYEGKIDCDSYDIFKLAAYSLQATNGSFVDEETAKTHLKNLSVLPMATLKEFPSICYCEDRILTIYRNLEGYTKASSIVSYMSIIERQPMYGIHYYEVKDRSGLPWWLGIGYKGISLFDFNDKNVPRRVFPWNQLENLYFRDRKFSVEVHDVKRASITRRALFLSNVNVHSWTTASGHLAKSMWTMAIAQHQFYLDCKKSKLASTKTVHEVAIDFSNKTSASVRHPRKGKCGHHARSMSACISDADFIPPISGKFAKRELCDALKDRKKALEDELQGKLKSLREISLQEAAVTGCLPDDDAPDDLRKSGVILSADAVCANSCVDEDKDSIEVMLAKLEEDVRMQKRITRAYQNLVDDLLVDEQVHKSRQQSHRRASRKLKDIEKKLQSYRQLAGKPLLRHEQQFCTSKGPSACSSPDLTNAIVSDRDAGHRDKSEMPGWPCVQSQNVFTCSKLNRHSTVDPATTTGLPHPLHSDCRAMNVASVKNMALYNIKTHETTNYDSSNDMTLLLPPDDCAGHCRNRWPSKHASLEGAYKRGTRTSSGATGAVRLDRNLSSGCLECHELFVDSDLPSGPISLTAFPDLADEDVPSIHAFQTRPKSNECNKCCNSASSFAHSASSREVFSSSSCATKEHGSRRSCDMKEHCSCCSDAVRKHCAICSHETGKCCFHGIRENPSKTLDHHQCTSSQTPKTKRRHVSPLKQRHSSLRDASSAFRGDMAIVLDHHRASNHQKFANMSQLTVEHSDVCSSHRHCKNSGANATLMRSCSVSHDRTSKRENIPAAGSGSSKLVIPSRRDVAVHRRAGSSHHHVRSQSVHVASDFSCTGLSVPASVCVGSKLEGPSAK